MRANAASLHWARNCRREARRAGYTEPDPREDLSGIDVQRKLLILARSFTDPEYRFTAGLTKSLGRFGLGLSAFYAKRGSYGVGLQLFAAIGREPHSGKWMLDAAPMAGNEARRERAPRQAP